MPIPTENFDLNGLTSWHGLRPGMPRAEAMEVLKAAGQGDADDPDDPCWILVDDWNADLQFDENGAQPLRQIAIADPGLLWSGTEIIEKPLHLVLQAMGAAAKSASWRPEHAVDQLFDDLKPLPDGPFIDSNLLRRGTVWLPALRLGLALDDGLVSEVVWRQARDVPRDLVGPVTPPQLAISARPDAQEFLQSGSATRGPVNPYAVYLTSLLILALIGLGVFAYQERQHWNMAPQATAKVIKVEPASHENRSGAYEVEFTDTEGRRQTTVLHNHDFYISPKEIGETVEVRYLTTDPIRVTGPASDRDVIFLRYTPPFIAVVGTYVVLLLVTGWISSRKKVVKKEEDDGETRVKVI